MSRPLPGSWAPERRQITMMFCDMVGSTALSVRLDPEELADVIQTYRQHCKALIERHGGFVARYVGDGILAYFGYPRAHENDAERAIRAALAIVDATWPTAATAGLEVHIGIATGVVVVGDLSQSGVELSAIGSAPNLAARLESIAAPGRVVVSELTRTLAGRLFDYRDLGRHDLKGFDAPVPAWQVTGERKVGSRFHALRVALRLVDRELELDALERLWARVRRGEGHAVLITSEAGVGKSRLAEALAERIDPGCLRIWYHASPNLQSSPLAPVVRQFTIAAGLGENDDEATKLRKLGQFVPAEAPGAPEIVAFLAEFLRAPGETGGTGDVSPHRHKRQIFEMLMRSLAAFAARGPMLLVIEDLHWIDPTSDELIGVLLERLSSMPILLVLTARPEFQAHWQDQRGLAHIQLGPLARSDAIAMIGLVCGERSMPDETVAEIADRTDGMPLFIEDLTRDVLESGAGAPGAPMASPVSIPTTLRDSLTSRLDRLGSAKAVAEVAAVIGREFSYELLAKVVELPEDRLRDELYQLVNAGLLVARRTSAAPGYAFKHALVRDAAYSCLLRKKQATLHAQIASTLIDAFPDTAESQPEVLAYHFDAAHDVANAVDFLLKAAKLSARRSGFREAIAQLERALQLLGNLASSREQRHRELNVHRTLGGIYAEQRGFSSVECGRAYTRALELCRELGDVREIFSVLSGLGSYAITRAEFDRCKALAAECLSRAAMQTAKPPFVMGHLLHGGTLFLQGELAEARTHLEKAIRIYDDDQPSRRQKQVLYVQDQKSTGLSYLALTLTIMGELERGLAAGESGLAHSRSLGGLHTVNFSLTYLAALHHIRGDTQSAFERATESLAAARELGFATWIGISQMIRGASMVKQGSHVEGLAELRRGMRSHADMEASAYQPFAMALLAEGLIATRQAGEALATLQRAMVVSDAKGERFYAAELRRLQAQAMRACGQPHDAERALHEAVDIAQRQQAKLFAERARAQMRI